MARGSRGLGGSVSRGLVRSIPAACRGETGTWGTSLPASRVAGSVGSGTPGSVLAVASRGTSPEEVRSVYAPCIRALEDPRGDRASSDIPLEQAGGDQGDDRGAQTDQLVLVFANSWEWLDKVLEPLDAMLRVYRFPLPAAGDQAIRAVHGYYVVVPWQALRNDPVAAEKRPSAVPSDETEVLVYWRPPADPVRGPTPLLGMARGMQEAQLLVNHIVQAAEIRDPVVKLRRLLANGSNVLVWRPGCPYSEKAHRILRNRGVPFEEVDVGPRPVPRAIAEFTGLDTVPVFYEKGQRIGGSEAVAARFGA